MSGELNTTLETVLRELGRLVGANNRGMELCPRVHLRRHQRSDAERGGAIRQRPVRVGYCVTVQQCRLASPTSDRETEARSVGEAIPMNESCSWA